MRHEIKIPFKDDFNSYFSDWKILNIKFKSYEDRYNNSVYYVDDKLSLAQDNLSGISNRKNIGLDGIIILKTIIMK